MTSYDYIAGKKRVLELIDKSSDQAIIDGMPTDDDLPFNKGYNIPVTAICITLKNSGKFFNESRQLAMMKLIKAFTSECLNILDQGPSDQMRDIGMHETSVYGVYSTPDVESKHDVYVKAHTLNTLKYMLNRLYDANKMPIMITGIGIATSKDIVFRADRDDSEVKDLVWMGRSLSTAYKLADLANGGKDPSKPVRAESEKFGAIVLSKEYYDQVKMMSRIKELFEKYEDKRFGTIYHGDLVDGDFYNWIKDGMKTD